jgi:hypothetical protein
MELCGLAIRRREFGIRVCQEEDHIVGVTVVGGLIARQNRVAHDTPLVVLKLYLVMGSISLDGVQVLRPQRATYPGKPMRARISTR